MLGFLEKPKNSLELTPEYLPSKLGGLPVGIFIYFVKCDLFTSRLGLQRKVNHRNGAMIVDINFHFWCKYTLILMILAAITCIECCTFSSVYQKNVLELKMLYEYSDALFQTIISSWNLLQMLISTRFSKRRTINWFQWALLNRRKKRKSLKILINSPNYKLIAVLRTPIMMMRTMTTGKMMEILLLKNWRELIWTKKSGGLNLLKTCTLFLKNLLLAMNLNQNQYQSFTLGRPKE